MTKTIEFVEKEIEFCQLKINKAKEEKVYRETIALMFPENKNINLATVNEIEISLNEYKIKLFQHKHPNKNGNNRYSRSKYDNFSCKFTISSHLLGHSI